jgi:hypothetical protein
LNHLAIAGIVFACVFGSALLGLYLRAIVPRHHLGDDSISVVKLTTGLIATMAALVLGLLISSAKSSFDAVNSELVHNAASIILLDRILARYGPDTQAVRSQIKQSYATSIQILGSGDAEQMKRLGSREAINRVEGLQRELAALSPQSPLQHQLQGRAVQITDEVLAARWLTLLQAQGSIPMPLLVALVVWLSIIFGTFGLFAPVNGTVVAALLLGALSTSGAIFLILELNTPLDGVFTVSLAPMRDALAMLGE